MSLQVFVQQVSGPVSVGVPLAGVWAYYGTWLGRSMSEVPDAPRRSGLRRLYAYILSGIGLAAAFIGLRMLLSFVVDALLGGQAWGGTLRLSLAAALSTLGVGLPLWLLTWRPMQAEALAPGDAGDHARRSLIRKTYLYLALFASVIGGMVAAGSLVYLLFNNLLGGGSGSILSEMLKDLELFALFALLGVYHGRTLGRDGSSVGRALAEKHAAFPTLVFDVEGGAFGAAMLAAIRKQTPRLPAAIQLAGQTVTKQADLPAFLSENQDYLVLSLTRDFHDSSGEIPDGAGVTPSRARTGTTPKAIILPAGLALDPPGNLRQWLEKYPGSRLVVPQPAQGWLWVGGAQPDLNQAALALRQLAEGQEVRQKAAASGWTIFLYVLAGLFALEAAGLLVGLVSSLLFR
jgi:hypothetical protein